MPFNIEQQNQPMIAHVQSEVLKGLKDVMGDHAKLPRGTQHEFAKRQNADRPSSMQTAGISSKHAGGGHDEQNLRARLHEFRGHGYKPDQPPQKATSVFKSSSLETAHSNGQSPTEFGELVGSLRNVDVRVGNDVVQASASLVSELKNSDEVRAGLGNTLEKLSAKELSNVQNLKTEALAAMGFDKSVNYVKEKAPKGTIKSIESASEQIANAVVSGDKYSISSAESILKAAVQTASRNEPNLVPVLEGLAALAAGACVYRLLGGKRALLALSAAVMVIEAGCSSIPTKSQEYLVNYQAANTSESRPEMASINDIPLSDLNAVKTIENIESPIPTDAAILVDSMQRFIAQNRSKFLASGIDPNALSSQYQHVYDGKTDFSMLLTKLKSVQGNNGPVDLYYVTYLNAGSQTVEIRLGMNDPNVTGQSDKFGPISATVLSLLSEGSPTSDPSIASFTLNGIKYWILVDPTDSSRSIVLSQSKPDITGGNIPPSKSTMVPPTQNPNVKFSLASFNTGLSVPTATEISATPTAKESSTATATAKAKATSVASATPAPSSTPTKLAPTNAPPTIIVASNTPVATASASENSQYTGIDINRPLETCPVITDIKAYWEWLQNSPIEPFGPNAVLLPLGNGNWNVGSPVTGVNLNPDADKNYNASDPSTWPFQQSRNIVCYNSGQLQYLLLPTAWLNPADRSKPIWTLSGFIYQYSYGVKATDKGVSQIIKAWLSNNEIAFFVSVGPGESYGTGNQNDYLEVQTANRYPDIKNRWRDFANSGNASSVSAPDIILEPQITLHH